jgi:hypothetical protein
VITVASDASIKYHFAGHVENGKDSISDPALVDCCGPNKPQQTAAPILFLSGHPFPLSMQRLSSSACCAGASPKAETGRPIEFG